MKLSISKITVLPLLIFVLIAGFVKAEEKKLDVEKMSDKELLVEFTNYKVEYKKLIDDCYRKKIIEKAEFKEKAKPLKIKIKNLGKEIPKRLLKNYLPSGKQAYGEYTWSCNTSDMAFMFSAKDKNDKICFYGEIYYHPENYPLEESKETYTLLCNGFKARRSKDKLVVVLINKIKLKVFAVESSLKSDAKIDEIVKSFNIEGLKKL
jgi:hypothetical protein